MQDSSAFQYLAIDTIHESTTNPRRTFDEAKLYELAESIKQHGLIQPITVRPNNEGFEIVAGARRYRASLLAEVFSVPARIVQIDDAQALEWQLVENSQRVDVHPFEEAQGFQRLLDMPGYDVTALVEASGKSASHVYARLSLLQLIPGIAEEFTQERITASHAALLARLPQEAQAKAYEECWRKDWQDKEPHLLPARHLAAWIQNNLYLNLADAPFDREDPTLNPTAGACVTCPRRSGYNTSLFNDVQGDQCLDAPCFHGKAEAHLDREIAAHPGIVQIETAWRNPKQQRAGSVQRGQVREIAPVIDNPDAEPVLPCPNTKQAIVVFGKRLGSTLTVCTDLDCPVHDPHAAAERAANPEPEMPQPAEVETEEEAAAREQEYAQRRKEFEEEQERKAEERKQEFQRQHEEYEAERARIAAAHKARLATLDRIVEHAPATFSAAQLRVVLSALISLDPCDFAEDVAATIVGDDENNDQAPEEILASTLASLPDDKLTSFALRLIFTGHTAIPRESDLDFLAQADQVFAPEKPKVPKSKGKAPLHVNPAAEKPAPKKRASSRKAA